MKTIDDQRGQPFTEREKRADELLQESLCYERARSRIEELIRVVGQDRKADTERSWKSGEDPDQSIDVVLDELRQAKINVSKKADEKWSEMGRCRARFSPGLERLANAVIVRAVEDYEETISSGKYTSEQISIEKFAEHGAERFTTLDLVSVLRQVRGVYSNKFIPLCEEIWEELLAEKAPKFRHRCPLCGGGLYYAGRKHGGDRVRCNNCALFWLVPEEGKR